MSEATPGARGRRDRREMAAAIGACVLGSATVLFAAGARWATARLTPATGGAEVVAPVAVEFGGADLAPATTSLGLLGLAGVVAVAASRRHGRTLVGVAVLAAGIGIAVAAGRVAADPVPAIRASTLLAGVAHDDAAIAAVGRSLAPVASCLGGAVLAAAGGLIAARGRFWPALSGRYQSRPAAPADAWEAIERGQDPTSESAPGPRHPAGEPRQARQDPNDAEQASKRDPTSKPI